MLDGTNQITISQFTTTAPDAAQTTQATTAHTLLAFLSTLVLGLVITWKRRSLRLVPLLAAVLVVSVVLGVSGCADNSTLNNPNATRAGSSSVTVTAAVSGAAAQTAPPSVIVTL